MATHVYQTLNFREYNNDEIYFLSYKPDLDFNRDKRADASIVDAPVRLLDRAKPRDITVDDIQDAFAWATKEGKLDYPLVVVLVGHGLQQKGLQLNVNNKGTEILTVEDLKGFLDDYQSKTHNSVVVIIEACYSGSFQQLSDSNQVIISSTDNGLAYYNDNGYESFLKLYFDELSQGVDFWKARDEVTKKIQTRRNRQYPQLNDSQNGEMARNLCLNGCWSYLPGTLTLWHENLGSIIPLGQLFDFNVQINAIDIGIRDVFASIITPEIVHQRDDLGYSWLPTPRISLHYLEDSNLRKVIPSKRWTGHFSQFNTAGKYVITVKAEDSKGFITEAEPIIITVKDGPGIIYPMRINLS